MFQKIFLYLYEIKVWNMRVLSSIVLGLALWAGNPFVTYAQQTNTTVSATKQKEADPIEITSYENRIVVKNAPIGSKLEIYSVVGIRVKEINMKEPSGEYTVDIAKGYYIVRLGETVRKVAIR